MKFYSLSLPGIFGFRLFRVSSLILYPIIFMAACGNGARSEYDLKGQVVAVDADRDQVTLKHEEIPGYMAAMTMPFQVKDEWALSVLSPGQFVEAVLVVEDNRSWIEKLRISGTGSIDQTVGKSTLPEPGSEIPDFTLLDQDNNKIHLHEFRGSSLLLTFIYTRCPLPDYCPLMSGNFAQLHYRLQSLPQSDMLPRLLTVSFDTDYDTPSVLRTYAARYMKPTRFDRWTFATGTPEEIRNITGYFGLVYEKESGQIVHSLVTALIGPDGRLVHLYLGNQWRPNEILKDLNLTEEDG